VSTDTKVALTDTFVELYRAHSLCFRLRLSSLQLVREVVGSLTSTKVPARPSSNCFVSGLLAQSRMFDPKWKVTHAGQTAIVTGAQQGIGAGLAEGILNDRFNVVGTSLCADRWFPRPA
jgi:hypothetical protein